MADRQKPGGETVSALAAKYDPLKSCANTAERSARENAVHYYEHAVDSADDVVIFAFVRVLRYHKLKF